MITTILKNAINEFNKNNDKLELLQELNLIQKIIIQSIIDEKKEDNASKIIEMNKEISLPNITNIKIKEKNNVNIINQKDVVAENTKLQNFELTNNDKILIKNIDKKENIDLNENLNKTMGLDLNDNLNFTQHYSINKSIDINSKFIFINELFNDNSKDFDEALEILDKQITYNDAYNWMLENIIKKYNINLNDVSFEYLCEIVKRKFINNK